ncbi:MAG: NAD(P)H-hydrate epimerase [Acidimicrobiia bacterium]|nr:NAD(P)H-hydrate epimerase [Acidimicrobiia bacterium]
MSERPVPEVRADSVAWITTEQMVEVDRIMIEELHIELVQMMENAGRSLARLAVLLWDPRTVCVFAGPGGNGGGGLAAARHLANWGVDTRVVTSRPAAEYRGVPGRQLDSARRLGIAVVDAPSPPLDLAIDAIIGYGLGGPPTGRTAELIEAVNEGPPPVLALDAPSGVDTTTGVSPGVAVAADATLTLATPKVGLRSATGVGDLYLADISVPPSVYATVGAAPAPRFGAGSILRVLP